MEGSWKTLRRLFHLWGLYARMDVLWILRDMKLFLSWVIADSILNLGAVAGMVLLAERFAGIGVWTKYQMIFMLGYTSFVSGCMDTLFNYNVSFISRRVGRGQLDHILIQPQPLWLCLLTEGFCPFSGGLCLLPGIGLLLWAIPHLSLAMTPLWMAGLFVSLIASLSIMLAFQYLWGSLAFWAPRSAEEINSSTMWLMRQLKPFPLDGLGGALSGSLLTLLPVGFIGWYPCRALLGLDRSAWSLGITPLAALFFAALALGVFRKGLQHYGRTGSQRYLSQGHRR
jgi:ABC-2 type transport system permease protein